MLPCPFPPTPFETGTAVDDHINPHKRPPDGSSSEEDPPQKRRCDTPEFNVRLESVAIASAAPDPVLLDSATHDTSNHVELPDHKSDSWMDWVDFSPVDHLVKSPQEPASEDAYDDIDDDDLAGPMSEPIQPSDQPPPSAIRHLDTDSRDWNKFDPMLQFSPVKTGSTMQPPTTPEGAELLDEDVDWQAVLSIADNSSSRSNTTALTTPGTLTPPRRSKSNPFDSPFVRPPVPPKVHDRPVIPGISSAVVIRVCFRIGELLALNAQCQRSAQPAVFELWARVTYSTREALSKTQHFQFVDLFTDRQPFPSGTLKDWKPGSLVDQQAQVFLNNSGPVRSPRRMCRAVCRMKRQERTVIGWVLDVMSVRETSWDEILWVRQLIARDSLSTESQESTA